MEVRELAVPGAFEFTPRVFPDDRGLFVCPFEEESFVKAVGHPLRLAQTNHSKSRRGVLRGMHFADVPPGQAKYVYCPQGALLDVVVDIRVGSPTFGTWDAVRLDPVDFRAVYVPEGVGARDAGARGRHGDLVPLLDRLQPRARARHRPARPRARPALAGGDRAAPVGQGPRAPRRWRPPRRAACCRPTPTARPTTSGYAPRSRRGRGQTRQRITPCTGGRPELARVGRRELVVADDEPARPPPAGPRA